MNADDIAADRAAALALTPVPRETADVLDVYVAALLAWNTRLNLVAASTVPRVWTRHIADSLQLLRWASGNLSWIDLGSGAGFPGMVLACAVKGCPGALVTLIEATRKKAEFLQHVAAATGTPARVLNERIETCAPRLATPEAVITARALAPLPRLLDLAEPFFEVGARALFLKGRDAEDELTAARESWILDLEVHQSLTDSGGHVLSVRHARRRSTKSRSIRGRNEHRG